MRHDHCTVKIRHNGNDGFQFLITADGWHMPSGERGSLFGFGRQRPVGLDSEESAVLAALRVIEQRGGSTVLILRPDDSVLERGYSSVLLAPVTPGAGVPRVALKIRQRALAGID